MSAKSETCAEHCVVSTKSGDLRMAQAEEVGGRGPPTIRPHAAVGRDYYFLPLPFGFLPISDRAAQETMVSASSSVMAP